MRSPGRRQCSRPADAGMPVTSLIGVTSSVIFDCDGVLVDSELVTNSVFAQMLCELGMDVTVEWMLEHCIGHSMSRCRAIVLELLGADLPSGFEGEYRERTARVLEVQLRPVPGVHDVLRDLAIPCCVASNGDHPTLRATLGSTRLLERFEGRIFSATDVERGKPAPDVFLLAAARMGARPERCAVIEDTHVGVKAATAAGMTVLGYAGRTSPGRLRAAGAAAVFVDMSELPALLAQHGSSG